ncbi:MAG: hypothetical protein U0930_18200 [Pirellulales bacterium]
MTDTGQVATASNAVEEKKNNDRWPPSIPSLVIAAIITVCLSLTLALFVFPLFSLPADQAKVPEQAPIEVYQKHDQAQHEVDRMNFALLFGLVGAILGGCSTFLCFRPPFRTLLIAAACGGILGALGGASSNEMFFNMRQTSGQSSSFLGISLDGMTQSIIGYALVWSMVGLGVGIGVGITKSAGKAVIAGISGFIGGILASMVFVITTAQISIGTTMNTVIPLGTVAQICWFLNFAILVVACIGLGSGEKRKKLDI